jgi:hypothetical protein
MNNPLKTAEKVAVILINDRRQYRQSELYLRLINSNCSLDDYFDKQKKIDNLQKLNTEMIAWEELKKRDLAAYLHEKSHFDTWGKYGIKSELYHILKTKIYFVMDVDFQEVSRKENYSKIKIIKILGEMLKASFQNSEEIKEEHLLDLLYYEILTGNIRKLHKNDFEKAFSRYDWDI